ncbi:MFS transporter [Hydrogenophaga palleronii]|uniref:MFS transporter n=1 Tax=Hydrogenophaga palleronii TaxID=65655 RepID=UPI0009FDAEFD|nr:MFS transporter [Hydrogenophaga palleronii]
MLENKDASTGNHAQLNWASVIVLFACTVASMAVIGIMVALMMDLGEAFKVKGSDLGWAIAVFSLPSAIVAIFCGGVVDRFGGKQVSIASTLICVLGSIGTVYSNTFELLVLSLAVGGVGFTGISVAAPAVIVNASSGEQQIRFMSFWSTYPPVAFACGLLLGAPFATTGDWKTPFAIHAILMAVLTAALFILPNVKVTGSPHWKGQLKSFAEVLKQVDVIRLSIVVAVPAALAYGTGLVAPGYLAQTHGVSMGASAVTVAVVKGIAMIACGIVTGLIISRNFSKGLLFALLAVLGLVAQLMIFHPSSTFNIASASLFVWLVAYGGLGAIAMSLLSSVVRHPSQSGVASGMIGQMISILSFAVPATYFGMSGWTSYVSVAALGLALSVIILPVWFVRKIQVA